MREREREKLSQMEFELGEQMFNKINFIGI